MSPTIAVVGSLNADYFTYTERLPTEGETIHGISFETCWGGKGANQAVGAGKLGGKVYMIGRLGSDSTAEDYIQHLNKNGVDATHVKKTQDTSNGIATIIVSKTGQNVIIIVGGANSKVTAQDVTDAKSVIEEADILLCQMEIPQEATIAALELCKGTSILNLAPAVNNPDSKLLTTPSIFCINEVEAGMACGLQVTNIEEAKKACDALLQKGCKAVLLTLGKEGAVYVSKEEPNHVVAHSPAVNAIDTTGAGDMFIGAFAYLMAYKKDSLSMQQILNISCCIAADSVTRKGTQPSFPGPDIIDACLAGKVPGGDARRQKVSCKCTDKPQRE